VENKGKIIQSKFDQVYDNLLARIKDEFNVGERLPTEMELAAAMNVNRMTVAKVMSVLKQEGYIKRKQGVGTILTSKPSQFVVDGIITFLPTDISRLRDPYFTPLANAVADEALKQGLINSWVGEYADMKSDLQRVGSLYEGGKYQGVIVIDPQIVMRETWREYFNGSREPRSVWINASPKGKKNFNCVDVDQESGVLQGLEFLFTQGYRRIGFLSRSPDTYNRRDRLDAFKSFHARNGLTPDEKQIILIDQAQSAKEAGYIRFKRLFKSEAQLDALFVADQGLLDGLQKMEQEHDLTAECHLPMVVFDYKFGGAFDRLVLASIIQPIEELGRAAVKMLMQLYAGKAGPPRQTMLMPKLVLRME
jgi:DNA-binding LacI/PurR family transcriptional regulator